MLDGGKGSKPRPYSVTQEEYAKRWDAIFGRDLDEKEVDKQQETEDNQRSRGVDGCAQVS